MLSGGFYRVVTSAGVFPLCCPALTNQLCSHIPPSASLFFFFSAAASRAYFFPCRRSTEPPPLSEQRLSLFPQTVKFSRDTLIAPFGEQCSGDCSINVCAMMMIFYLFFIKYTDMLLFSNRVYEETVLHVFLVNNVRAHLLLLVVQEMCFTVAASGLRGLVV